MNRTVSRLWPVPLLALFLIVAPCLVWAQQANGQRAVLHVRLPADAELTVDGKKTMQTGQLRHFQSPPLQPGKSYHYTFVWTFRMKGEIIRRETTVNFVAGDDKEVNLLEVKEAKPIKPKDREDKPDKSRDKRPVTKPEVKFVPPPAKVLEKMLEVAEIKKTDVVYNLSCGDGQIVIAAAEQYKCKAVGVDNDEQDFRNAEKNVKKKKLDDLVTIKKQDIFEVDLEPASVVLIYLNEEANALLVPQIQKMKPGSRIVSHDFKIEDYPPKADVTVMVEGSKHHIYLYETPLKKK